MFLVAVMVVAVTRVEVVVVMRCSGGAIVRLRQSVWWRL